MWERGPRDKIMAQIIYIVTQGEYSDYHIEAVFSTRALADKFIGNAPDGEYEISAWEIDAERKPRRWGKEWACYLRLDGSVVDEIVNAIDCTNDKDSLDRCEGRPYAMPEGEPLSKDAAYFRGISPISAAHALKLAAEARQKWLRENPTITMRSGLHRE